jgi:hypothetical protein
MNGRLSHQPQKDGNQRNRLRTLSTPEAGKVNKRLYIFSYLSCSFICSFDHSPGQFLLYNRAEGCKSTLREVLP